MNHRNQVAAVGVGVEALVVVVGMKVGMEVEIQAGEAGEQPEEVEGQQQANKICKKVNEENKPERKMMTVMKKWEERQNATSSTEGLPISPSSFEELNPSPSSFEELNPSPFAEG